VVAAVICLVAAAAVAFAYASPILGNACVGLAMLAILAYQAWVLALYHGASRPPTMAELSRMVDAIPVPAYALDVESLTILTANDAACKLLGFPPGGLAGQAILDLTTDWVHERTLKGRERLASEGQVAARDIPWRIPDGSLVWLDVDARVLEGSCPPISICVLHDISERRAMEEQLARHSQELRRINLDLQENIARLARSEARYHALFTEIPDAVLIVVAGDAIIREANPQAAVLWGQALPQLVGQPVEALDRSGSSRLPDIVRRAATNGTEMAHEVPLLLHADHLIYADIAASRVSMDGQEWVQLVIRDVTDRHQLRKQIEETNRALERKTLELQRATAELARANAVKSQFLADMSHEIRTPLNAINGFAELLADPSFGTLNEQQRTFVDRISEAGQHLLQLINDVLDLAKVEAGTITLDRQLVRLDRAAEQVINIIKGSARNRQISIHLDVAAEEPLVFADERRIKQVLFNLLSNAIRYSPEGSEVRVKVELEGETARVSVSDQGVGIPAHEHERIFQEFVQLGDSNQRAGGAGLGLPLSRKLVRLHGGDIGVRSAPGQGSTFWFTLPIGHAPEADVPPQSIGDVHPDAYRPKAAN
jgi:PAS domain S-box-containing protein